MMMFLVGAAHAASAPVVDRIAAVVNDEVVALSDVYDLGRDFVEQRCPAAVAPIPEPAPLPEPVVPAEGVPPIDPPTPPVVPEPAPAEPTLGGEPGQPVVPGTLPPEPTEPAVPPVEPITAPGPLPEPVASETPAPEPAPSEPVTLADPLPPPAPGVERCAAEAELEILDALIRRVLIRQELVRLELDVTAADVDQAIDRTVRQYQLADRQALKAEVEGGGKRWDQYRDELLEFLRTQAFQGRVLAPRVTVTEDELNDFYQRTARKVTKPVVKVSGLGMGIPAEATPEEAAMKVTEAELLVEDLNAGKISWEDAVERYDQGAAGMFANPELVAATSYIPPLSTTILAAPVGVVQAPVRMDNPNGMTVLFILRVDQREERSEVAPFEEVKDQIKDQVFSEKLADAEEEWYQRARREAAVDVKLKAE